MPQLKALREKYEQIFRLRQLHARAREEPGYVEPDPRREMAELARRYPGALREMDELPIEVIQMRLGELAAAEAGATESAPWMRAQTTFHALARGALVVKRWLRGRRLTAELDAAFAAAIETLPDSDDAKLWAEDLAAIASPPGGRLMNVVYARLARELGTDVTSARQAVLPRPSLRRRRA